MDNPFENERNGFEPHPPAPQEPVQPVQPAPPVQQPAPEYLQPQNLFEEDPSDVTEEPAVESDVVGDRLHVSVRLSVFYGYPFTKLAEEVRSAVATAVNSQMGVEVGAVNVCIDNLVFPKE